MKLIRYRDLQGRIHFAHEVTGGIAHRIEGDPFGAFAITSERAQIASRLAPIAPIQILGIGLNYRQHAEETKARLPTHPIVFHKNVAAVAHPHQAIWIPQHLASTEVDYEGELAVVIGKTCRNVSPERALDHVLGYTCANDVSARDWQKTWGGSQWCRGKSFDTFAPLGPCLVTTDDIPNPNALRISTTLNGAIVQESTTADMIFDVPTLIAFLSGSTTLPAGTVILTGTPAGVGMARTPPVWLQPGDVVTVEIEGIGALTNPVALEAV
ncbi:MAG TPA: fumarylacetoacetate hydrolase family protein [Polyangia bacterium]|jgi:2-keto-4-pentenoate hydratase/2-oxohepta-3-ene-1,7-dioic acid hydratase in catechol pathway